MPVHVFGRGEDGQIGDTARSDSLPVSIFFPDRVREASCGSGHSLVVSSTGRCFTWGRGDDGRLGHRSAPHAGAASVPEAGWALAPKEVLLEEAEGGAPRRVLAASCGSYHTAFIDEVGWLWACGGALYGKLGLGRDVSALVPHPVPLLSGPRAVRVVAVGCGSRHTVALSAAGDVFSFGCSERGVLGLSRAALCAAAGTGTAADEPPASVYAPVRLAPFGEGGVAQLAVCGAHTLAVDARGAVWSWGEGRFGRLGHGDEEDAWTPRRVAPHALGADGFGCGSRIVAVAAGGFHSVAVTAEGVAYAWGGGEHGQLGLGAVSNVLAPARVVALDAHVLRSAACGWSHTLFLSDRGGVWSCGNVDHSKLGLTREEADAGLAASAAAGQQGAAAGQPARGGRCITLPRAVGGLAGLRVTRVSAYNEHSLALSEHCGPSLVGWRDEPLALGTLPLFPLPPLELGGGAEDGVAPASGSGSRRASLSTLSLAQPQQASQRTGAADSAIAEGEARDGGSISWEELFAEAEGGGSGGGGGMALAAPSPPPSPPTAPHAGALPSPPLLGWGPHFSSPVGLLRRGVPTATSPVPPAPPSGLLPRSAPGTELVAALARLVCCSFASDVDVVVVEAADGGGEAPGRRTREQGAAEEVGGGGGGGPAPPAPTTLPAHRALLASRCDAFAALLVHAQPRVERPTVTLHARVSTVKALLFFLYTDCLPGALAARDALELAMLADYLHVVRLIALLDALLAHKLQDAAPHTAAAAVSLLLHADALGWWDSPLRTRLVAAVALHFEAAAACADFATLVRCFAGRPPLPPPPPTHTHAPYQRQPSSFSHAPTKTSTSTQEKSTILEVVRSRRRARAP
jgi:alpha-tubulin suppressor-like RCC1 family protein